MRRHLVGSVTQPPQRPVDRVFAHRAGPRTNRGEYISCQAGNHPQFLEQGQRLPRKRYMMRLTHLHLFGGDDPDGALKIALLPFRMATLDRTDNAVRYNMQRLFGEAQPLITVARPAHGAKPAPIGTRDTVLP